MLDVFFWGLNQEQGTSTPHGNCMCLWSLVQNPRRSQGISRLFSQSPERTLEKKKKNRKIYAFRTSFPLAIPKRVTLQLFWAFSLLSGSPAGLEDTENKAAFISGSLVDIHHGLGPVPSMWMATHGLLTWTTRVKARPAPGHCQARAVPRLLHSPEGHTDQWQNRGPCPEHWLTTWELHASFTNVSEMLAHQVWYFMDNCPGVTLEPSK